MAGQIRVNTDQVGQIASEIENLNSQLREELESSKAVIDKLAATWEGDAATATIEAFSQFAASYFEDYEELIAQYVAFLRVNVEQGYTETETANTGLAEAFL